MKLRDALRLASQFALVCALVRIKRTKGTINRIFIYHTVDDPGNWRRIDVQLISDKGYHELVRLDDSVLLEKAHTKFHGVDLDSEGWTFPDQKAIGEAVDKLCDSFLELRGYGLIENHG